MIANGVTAIDMNFRSLIPRLPKTKPWLVAERIDETIAVGVSFEPEDSDELSLYMSWVTLNTERLDYAVEPVGDFLAKGARQAILAEGIFDPYWIPTQGFRTLDQLANTYDRIVVPQSAFDSTKPVSQRINRLASQKQTHFHGLGIGKADILTSTSFSSASSGSWRSAEQYGETVVWDGRTLHRFPAADKKSSRARWAPYIAQSGVDPEAIEADDKDALVALSIWSWLQLEAHLSLRRRELDPEVSDISPEGVAGENGDRAQGPSGTSVVAVRTDGRKILPVIDLEQTRDEDDRVTSTTVRMASTSMRRCDHCDLAEAHCPGFVAGSECAFDIPVMIRTKAQLQGVWGSVMEMQTQRVFMARYQEELEGTVSPILSNELDRLSRLSDAFSRALDNRDTLKLSVEAHASSGVISRLFGQSVGDNAAALPSGPVPAETVTNTALAILDADEVSDI